MFRFTGAGLSCLTLMVLVSASNSQTKKNEAAVTCKVTNGGRAIQMAQDGAYLNLLVIPDTNDKRLVTRIVTKPVDAYLTGVVAELRHGETDDYSYILIMARRPRCEHELLRDSHSKDIRGKGPKCSKITLENPASDDVEVLLESDPKSDKTLTEPTRYTNGCTRAWLFF